MQPNHGFIKNFISTIMKVNKEYKAAFDENKFQLFKHLNNEEFIVIDKLHLQLNEEMLPAIVAAVSKLDTIYLTNDEKIVKRINYIKIEL